MDILKNFMSVLNSAQGFTATRNYYYENHDCHAQGKVVKVDLKYKIKDNNSDKVVLFGACPFCNTVFYHEDYENSRI